jgi:hypothetical protein
MMMKHGCGKGTWKVRNSSCIGALNVRHNELLKLDFDIVALQETQSGSGIQKFDNFTLFISRSESKKYEFGCGFCVRGEFLKYVKDFKIKNERICYLRLQAKWFSCSS